MNAMLRRLGCALSAAVLSVPVIAATDGWSVEAGAARAGVRGIRTYALPAYKMRENLTRTANAGFVRVGYARGPWSVGLASTGYDTLRAAGYSQNSDIFDRSDVSLQVIVPLEFAERIREYSLDASWRWTPTRRVELAAGPVVSWFDSSADLNFPSFRGTIGSNVFTRVVSQVAHYRESDLRLGGALTGNFALSQRWRIGAGYRYAAPPSRTLHLWSASLGWQF